MFHHHQVELARYMFQWLTILANRHIYVLNNRSEMPPCRQIKPAFWTKVAIVVKMSLPLEHFGQNVFDILPISRFCESHCCKVYSMKKFKFDEESQRMLPTFRYLVF